MTLYQFNRAFSRIGQFKTMTLVLYAMLSSEVDIEPCIRYLKIRQVKELSYTKNNWIMLLKIMG